MKIIKNYVFKFTYLNNLKYVTSLLGTKTTSTLFYCLTRSTRTLTSFKVELVLNLYKIQVSLIKKLENNIN